jgi:hypothetical protein
MPINLNNVNIPLLMPLLYREFTGAPTVHIDGSSESTNMVVEVPPLST